MQTGSAGAPAPAPLRRGAVSSALLTLLSDTRKSSIQTLAERVAEAHEQQPQASTGASKAFLPFGDTVTCISVAVAAPRLKASPEKGGAPVQLGEVFVAGGMNNQVRLYQVETGVLFRTFWVQGSSGVTAVALSCVGGSLKLIAANFSGGLFGYDVMGGALEAHITDFSTSISCLATSKRNASPGDADESRDGASSASETGWERLRQIHSMRNEDGGGFAATELLAVGGKTNEVLVYTMGLGSGGALAIRLRDRVAHPSAVLCVAMDAAGTLLAIGGDAKCVVVWEVDGEELGAGRHRSGLPDAKPSKPPSAAGGGRRQTFPPIVCGQIGEQMGEALRGARALEPKHIFPTASAAHTVAISADGHKIAIGDATHASVWELRVGVRSRPDGTEGTQLYVEKLLDVRESLKEGCVAFCGKGDRLAIGSGHFAQVLSIKTGAPVRTLNALSGRVRSVAIGVEGRHLMLGGFDKTISIYHCEEGARLFKFSGGESMPTAYAVAASDRGDERDIVVLGGDCVVDGQYGRGLTRVYSMHHHNPERLIAEWPREKPVRALALTQDASQCAVGADDHRVLVHDVFSGHVQAELRYNHAKPLAFVWTIAFSSTANRLAVGSWEFNAYVYENPLVKSDGAAADGSENAPRAIITSPIARFAQGDRVYGVSLDAEGDRLFVGGRDKTVRMYTVLPPRMLWKRECTDTVTCVALASDGTLCAYGGHMASVTICMGSTGSPLHKLVAGSTVRTMHILAGSHKLLVGGDLCLLSVYDMDTASEVICLPFRETIVSCYATAHSLLLARGASATMFGKSMSQYAWQDQPSFDVARVLVAKNELTKRCIRPVIATHPEIVNARDFASGRSFLHYMIEHTNDTELLRELIRGKHAISLASTDKRGRTVIGAALVEARRSAVVLLLEAVAEGRVSRVPSAMAALVSNFDRLAREYPKDFLHFIRAVRWDEEPEIFEEHMPGDADEGTFLPICADTWYVRGSESRCPVSSPGFWADLARPPLPWAAALAASARAMRRRLTGRAAHGYAPLGEDVDAARLAKKSDLPPELSPRDDTSNASEGSLSTPRQRSFSPRLGSILEQGGEPRLAENDKKKEQPAAAEAVLPNQRGMRVRALRCPFEAFGSYYDPANHAPLALVTLASDATGLRDVYASEIVQALIHFKWTSYGMQLYLFQASSHLVYLVCCSAFAWRFVAYLHGADDFPHFTLADGKRIDIIPPAEGPDINGLAIALCAFALYHVFLEVMQVLTVGLLAHFTQIINWFDLAAIGMQAFVLRIYFKGADAEVAEAATCSTLLGFSLAMAYIKLVYYFRGFTAWGMLVRMVAQIISDLRPFLVITVVLLLGFAQGLGLILYRSSDSDFGTPDTAMLSAFNYGLYGEFGDFFASFTTDGSSHVNTAATLLFNLMMITVQVILLNLLIAVMSDSYDKVRENSELESLHERAKLVLELEATWLHLLAMMGFRAPLHEDKAFFPMWLHVLKPWDESDTKAKATTGTWNGRMDAIRRHIETINKTVSRHGEAVEARLERQDRAIHERLAQLDVMGDSIARLADAVEALAGEGRDAPVETFTAEAEPSTSRARGKSVSSSGGLTRVKSVYDSAQLAKAAMDASEEAAEEAAEETSEEAEAPSGDAPGGTRPAEISVSRIGRRGATAPSTRPRPAATQPRGAGTHRASITCRNMGEDWDSN